MPDISFDSNAMVEPAGHSSMGRSPVAGTPGRHDAKNSVGDLVGNPVGDEVGKEFRDEVGDELRDEVGVAIDALSRTIAANDRVVVAYSGGVDSTLVAAVADRVCDTVAVTAVSPSLASFQHQTAVEVAKQIGLTHQTIDTDEMTSPDYRRNDRRRCFYCKQSLYHHLSQIVRRFGDQTSIVSGTNADDLGDYRPGIEAGRAANVQTPLADLGIGKSMVRLMARRLGLPNADLAASPCLSSRIAYGTEVTADRLRRIDRMETQLRQSGFDVCRVRLYGAQTEVHDKNRGERRASRDRAMIEVPAERIAAATDLLGRLNANSASSTKLVSSFCMDDWSEVTIATDGFRSGRMNDVVGGLPVIEPSPRVAGS